MPLVHYDFLLSVRQSDRIPRNVKRKTEERKNSGGCAVRLFPGDSSHRSLVAKLSKPSPSYIWYSTQLRQSYSIFASMSLLFSAPPTRSRRPPAPLAFVSMTLSYYRGEVYICSSRSFFYPTPLWFHNENAIQEKRVMIDR